MATRNERWTRAEARKVIHEYEASGLSLSAFARRRALSYERVRKWRMKLRREPEMTAAPRLVELVERTHGAPSTTPEPIGKLTLRCPSGHCVELVDVGLASGVRLLLDLLEERSSC